MTSTLLTPLEVRQFAKLSPWQFRSFRKKLPWIEIAPKVKRCSMADLMHTLEGLKQGGWIQGGQS